MGYAKSNMATDFSYFILMSPTTSYTIRGVSLICLIPEWIETQKYYNAILYFNIIIL